MVCFYFSGTGNSKYIAELFSKEMDIACHSIEDDTDNFSTLIDDSEIVGFCYPVYFSRVPRIMREFVMKYMEQLKSKKIVIFCTQMIFSGDGARALTDVFPRGHIEVIYAEHFTMPNNVPNYPWLPRAMLVPSDKKIKKCIAAAEHKTQAVCRNVKSGIIKKRGFNIFSRILGLPQGITASAFEKRAYEVVAVTDACNGCGLCVSICPMKNLKLENGHITHSKNCTVCYRCINKCPQKAITILFYGKVTKQYKGLNSAK